MPCDDAVTLPNLRSPALVDPRNQLVAFPPPQIPQYSGRTLWYKEPQKNCARVRRFLRKELNK
jgi:hypothetical protein